MRNDNYSFSKNYQSNSIIRKMYEKCFKKSSNDIIISLLTGGMKSAVYLIQDGDNKIVLKISTIEQEKLLTFERNTIYWEAKMLELMQLRNIPAPRLLKYDDSCKICNAPYIFMTYIDGKGLDECRKSLTETEINNIELQIGKICSEICKIKSDEYYLPSNPNKKFKNNFEFVLNLFILLIEDAKIKNIKIGNLKYDEILELVSKYRENLNNISNLCLVHSDIWDGNVIVQNGNVLGFIDFGDLYFCDEIMTYYFHTTKTETSKNFLRGFGKEKLSLDEKIRVIIYRILILLKMYIESNYKQFSNNDWIIEKLYNEISKLKEMNNDLKLKGL